MDADPEPQPGREDLVAAVGTLAEPNRRAIYDYVVGRRGWVGRDEAAEAVGIQRGIAAHHLDRLADAGLLEVDYRRLNDRRGPGAGRPAKVYRRATIDIAVSLPPRRYELVGQLLARAVDRSQRDGTPIADALDRAARSAGQSIGTAACAGAGRRVGVRDRRSRFFEVLRAHGFVPETAANGVTILHNCPFHDLAQEHTELVCGMNLSLLEAVLAEFGDIGLRAALEPEADCCCVRFHSGSDGSARRGGSG